MPTNLSLPDTEGHADPVPPLSIKDDEISILDILIVLAQQKRIIATVTACFAIIAVILSFVLPKRYTATVSLLPPQQSSSIASALASQLGSLGSMASMAGGSIGLKNPNDMYVAMLKSRTVEDAMVQHFGLMQEYHQKYLSDARRAFEGHTTVDANGKDGLIHISIEDRDPNRAAELANGYVDQYRHFSEHLAITEASQRRLFFEQQLEQAKNNLASAEESLKITEQKTGMIQLDSQARALIESAATLRAQVTAKEVQIQSMRTFATSENSQLVQAQQELDSLRAQLAKLGGEDASEAGLLLPKGRVPEAGLEYVRKLRDVKYAETVFEILARQFEVAKLDEARQGALIQVVDAAVPPDKRSFPKRGIILTVVSLCGFLFGLLTALIHAGLQRTRDDPQLAYKLGLLRKAFSLGGGFRNAQ